MPHELSPGKPHEVFVGKPHEVFVKAEIGKFSFDGFHIGAG
jgi:hypothetical protein